MIEHWTQRHMPRQRLIAFLVVAAILAVGLGYGAYLLHYWQYRISTDDAYVTAHVAPMSARVSGTVIAVQVSDNQDVKSGEILMRLDPKDYEVALAQARAVAAAATADLENARVNIPLTDETTRSLVQQAEAAAAASRDASQGAVHDLEEREGQLKVKQAAETTAVSAIRMAEADFERASLDRDRYKDLVQARMIAQMDYDHADAAFKSAQAALDVAQKKLGQAREETLQAGAAVRSQTSMVAQLRRRAQEAEAALTNARSQRQQVKMRQAQMESARGHVEQAMAALRQAELNLEYTTIKAPVGGRITNKTVEVGQVIQPGQPLLSIVDLDNVWVVANFKETALTHVRAGQRATIVVDTYPGNVFNGQVDSIQAGSGAVFSLLPPENATGNFVKVVQRVPIKIVFGPGENARHLLVPGMSVVPTIEIR